jgi:hypothetical protein
VISPRKRWSASGTHAGCASTFRSNTKISRERKLLRR